MLAAGPSPRSRCCSSSGAIGKSAQIPLHVWLPDAMEGPTPVSALIHAATMVTAGVFLRRRAHAVLRGERRRDDRRRLGRGGTALLAGTVALVQPDIKRVLAYSTISQLGYMFLAVRRRRVQRRGLHGDRARLLQGHALPRRRLGDPRQHDNQDMRIMGGLRKFMPFTAGAFIVAWLAIAACRRFSGFWSKDEILAEAFASRATTACGSSASSRPVLTALYMTGECGSCSSATSASAQSEADRGPRARPRGATLTHDADGGVRRRAAASRTLHGDPARVAARS